MIGQVIAGVMFIALVAVLSYKAWFEKEEVKRKQCCECRKTFYEAETRLKLHRGKEVSRWEGCPYCYSSKWIIV